MPDSEDPRDRILDAALSHVPFDGWSDATLAAAARDAGVDPAVARGLFPRGAVDLALAFHRRGDEELKRQLAAADLEGMRFRDRVAFAVRLRLQIAADREAVRRGATLFALPQHAADGARALWQTADAIWTALGDTADDVNWYTKRASLAAVHGATVLYWLGDDSPGHQATWDFLDRRIEGIMQIEKLKAGLNDNPLTKPFMTVPNWIAARIRPPRRDAAPGLPGRWTGRAGERGA